MVAFKLSIKMERPSFKRIEKHFQHPVYGQKGSCSIGTLAVSCLSSARPGGLLGLIFAGDVLLASQIPYPIIFCGQL